MKKRFLSLLVVLTIGFYPFGARSDMFGGDVAVLLQILQQSLLQLAELKSILQSGQDSLGLLQDVNRGIYDSLKLLDSISPFIDAGLYKDLRRTVDVARHLADAYGVIADSPDKQAQTDTDQVVSEAITMNNSLYDYAGDLDKVGEQIKQYAQSASPGVAQQLTAQSLGVMVHVMNQQLRATATGLKLSAQALAIQNKKDKTQTVEYLSEAQALGAAMQNNRVNFTFPRF